MPWKVKQNTGVAVALKKFLGVGKKHGPAAASTVNED
jgi:hypothetical protein